MTPFLTTTMMCHMWNFRFHPLEHGLHAYGPRGAEPIQYLASGTFSAVLALTVMYSRPPAWWPARVLACLAKQQTGRQVQIKRIRMPGPANACLRRVVGPLHMRACWP